LATAKEMLAAVAEALMMAAEMITETAAMMTVNSELAVCEERVGRHCLLQLNKKKLFCIF
jgi:hypothetical protein